jgi:hypothetical protein
MLFNFFIVFCFIECILFTGFLLGLKKPVDENKYFQAMFRGYRSSKLRWFWKTLIFGFEYLIGIIILFIINVAYYPAELIRKMFRFIFINGTLIEKEKELAKYADKTNETKKKRNN